MAGSHSLDESVALLPGARLPVYRAEVLASRDLSLEEKLQSPPARLLASLLKPEGFICLYSVLEGSSCTCVWDQRLILSPFPQKTE